MFGPVFNPVFFSPLWPVAMAPPAPVPAVTDGTFTLGGKAPTLGGKPITISDP